MTLSFVHWQFVWAHSCRHADAQEDLNFQPAGNATFSVRCFAYLAWVLVMAAAALLQWQKLRAEPEWLQLTLVSTSPRLLQHISIVFMV